MGKGIERPMVACEIASDRVLAARSDASHSRIEMHASRKLPTGAVSPALSGANLADRRSVSEAIRGALEALAGRSRDVIAVLPDNSVRVLLLDFDTLPDRREEADGIVRFRIRKSLPFDVDKAALSYHRYATAGGTRVVAAVCPADIEHEYEQAFRDAGYEPGVVLPSILATLGNVDGSRPTMVVKIDPGVIVLAIVDQDELRLVRNIDVTTGFLSAAACAELVYPSVVFYEDSFGKKLERLLLAGNVSVPELANELREQTGIRVEEILGRSDNIPATSVDSPSSLAGVIGALIG